MEASEGSDPTSLTLQQMMPEMCNVIRGNQTILAGDFLFYCLGKLDSVEGKIDAIASCINEQGQSLKKVATSNFFSLFLEENLIGLARHIGTWESSLNLAPPESSLPLLNEEGPVAAEITQAPPPSIANSSLFQSHILQTMGFSSDNEYFAG